MNQDLFSISHKKNFQCVCVSQDNDNKQQLLFLSFAACYLKAHH